mgnify:CR=1 FL=1|jgi:hypothetical protein
MTMQYEFPIKKINRNGKEYIWMESEVFYQFFVIMSEYMNIEQTIVDLIKKKYNKAKKYKKKRLRLKKEKEVLQEMIGVLMYYK